MTGRGRLAALGALAAIVLGAGGCASGPFSGDDQLPGADELPDCSASDCAAEVAAFGKDLQALDGVEGVEDLRYQPRQITAGPSVDGVLRVAAGTDCAALEEDVGRLLWESRVNPVGSTDLRCFLPGETGSDYEYVSASFVLTADAERAEQEWGPRG